MAAIEFRLKFLGSLFDTLEITSFLGHSFYERDKIFPIRDKLFSNNSMICAFLNVNL